MPTHDYDIANQSGAAFRTDLNNALKAIVSNNSNSSSPATTYAYQWWADTSAGVLKIRNSANNAWIELLQLDGTLTLEDGTAAAPALGFRDNLNTGIFSGSANEFNISTAGTERFVINSAGNCGIGTQSPAQRLHLQSAADCVLRVTSADGSGAFLDLGDVSDPDGGRINYDTGSNLVFSTASTERLRINSSGFVGIGTSSPDKTGIQNNVKVLQIDGGDGAELILGNSQSANVSTNHIGAIAFKNIDDSTGNAPHFAGIRSNCTDTSGSMDLKFYAGSTEFEANTPHMTINATGIIGVGDNTTSPSSDCLLELRKNSNTAYDVDTAVTNPLLTLKNGNSGTNHCVGLAFNGTSSNGEAYITLVGVSSSESALFVGMRNGSQRRVKVAIERTGRLICGTNGSTVNSMGGQVEIVGAIGFNDTGLAIKRTSTDTTSRTFQKFVDFNGNAQGSIGMGASTVTYNTSSDYRLKENETLISDGITRIKQLIPRRFNYKSEPEITQDGFFAHEVQEVIPEAVDGEKDEMAGETFYEEGDNIPEGKEVGMPKTYSTTKMNIQQLDYSKLTPLLTAALQEAIAKIETLETKVAALEAA